MITFFARSPLLLGSSRAGQNLHKNFLRLKRLRSILRSQKHNLLRCRSGELFLRSRRFQVKHQVKIKKIYCFPWYSCGWTALLWLQWPKECRNSKEILCWYPTVFLNPKHTSTLASTRPIQGETLSLRHGCSNSQVRGQFKDQIFKFQIKCTASAARTTRCLTQSQRMENCECPFGTI